MGGSPISVHEEDRVSMVPTEDQQESSSSSAVSEERSSEELSYEEMAAL